MVYLQRTRISDLGNGAADVAAVAMASAPAAKTSYLMQLGVFDGALVQYTITSHAESHSQQ